MAATDASKKENGAAKAAARRGASAPEGTGKLVHLRIRRQDAPDKPETRRWEEFKVPHLPLMNVISCLQQIQRNPVTTDGKEVVPVVWESVCLEEVCGSCTMVINGRVRQSCSALIDQIAPK